MIPLCWKCTYCIKQPIPDSELGGQVMIGCELEPCITSYEDAEKHCPVVKEIQDAEAASRV